MTVSISQRFRVISLDRESVQKYFQWFINDQLNSMTKLFVYLSSIITQKNDSNFYCKLQYFVFLFKSANCITCVRIIKSHLLTTLLTNGNGALINGLITKSWRFFLIYYRFLVMKNKTIIFCDLVINGIGIPLIVIGFIMLTLLQIVNPFGLYRLFFKKHWNGKSFFLKGYNVLMAHRAAIRNQKKVELTWYELVFLTDILKGLTRIN